VIILRCRDVLNASAAWVQQEWHHNPHSELDWDIWVVDWTFSAKFKGTLLQILALWCYCQHISTASTHSKHGRAVYIYYIDVICAVITIRYFVCVYCFTLLLLVVIDSVLAFPLNYKILSTFWLNHSVGRVVNLGLHSETLAANHMHHGTAFCTLYFLIICSKHYLLQLSFPLVTLLLCSVGFSMLVAVHHHCAAQNQWTLCFSYPLIIILHHCHRTAWGRSGGMEQWPYTTWTAQVRLSPISKLVEIQST